MDARVQSRNRNHRELADRFLDASAKILVEQPGPSRVQSSGEER